MTNWISELFFALIVTGIIGDVLLGIWWLFRTVFIRWSPTLVYNTLRWISVLFLVPVGYLTVRITYSEGVLMAQETIFKTHFWVSKPMNYAIMGIAVVWLLAMSYQIVRNVIQKCENVRISKFHIEVLNAVILEEQKRIQKILKIKRKITVYQNPEIDIPYTAGYLRKIIVFPCEHYTREQIAVTLYHEMTHVKKYDLFFRVLGRLILIIQCLNPGAYLLNDLLNKWSECDCDEKALDAMTEERTPKQYYNILYEMAVEEPERKARKYLLMLVDSKSGIEGRIDYMLTLKNRKSVSKVFTAALTAVFVLLSTGTAYAAGVAVAEVNQEVYDATEEVAVVAASIPDDSDKQFVVTAEESEGVSTIYYESDIMAMSVGSINKSVPADTRCVGEKIYLKKGSKVSMACAVNPTTTTYWYGLMDSNGNSRVIQATGVSSGAIDVTKTGYYRVMVQNLSDVETEFACSYTY